MSITTWFRRNAIVSKQRRLVRKKHFHSFDTAKSVGIVFKVDTNQMPAEVYAAIKFLKEKNIPCSVLGFYNVKLKPGDVVSSSTVSFFSKRELNWYGRPASDEVTKFLQNTYDIVIDFCREPNVYPVQYIVATVNAAMKIGGIQYPHCPYDLIVDVQQNAEGYVDQIKHYLAVINNPKN